MRRWFALVILCACQFSCEPKPATPPEVQAADSATTQRVPPPAPEPKPKPSWFEGSWTGSYDVHRHLIERPSLQAAWLRDQGSLGVGSGNVVVEVAADGMLGGRATGVLGPQALVGKVAADLFAFQLQPQPRQPLGFSGYASCQRRDPARLSCMLAASSGDGNLVRRGQITLQRSKEPSE